MFVTIIYKNYAALIFFNPQINTLIGTYQKWFLAIGQGNLGFLANGKTEIFQQQSQADEGLHFAKTQADAITRSFAKGQKQHWITFRDFVMGEVIGIECIRIGIVTFIAMYGSGGDEDLHILFDHIFRIARHHIILQGHAIQDGQDGVHAKGFWKGKVRKNNKKLKKKEKK